MKGVTFSVGSTNFSENVLAGQDRDHRLQSDGAKVTDLTNVPGSASARQAMTDGQIGGIWEYTGTGWSVYLGHDKPRCQVPDHHAVRAEEGAEGRAHVVWRVRADQPARRAHGLLEKYHIWWGSQVPRGNLKTYQTGAIYDATAAGKCNVGEVFTTDGRIVALDLRVLEDDRSFFPRYNVSFVVRRGLIRKYAQIKDLIGPAAEKLTDKVLLGLNAKIDVDGQEPAEVAFNLPKKEGSLTD